MESRDEIEAQLRSSFAGRRDVVAVYLFGSTARGSASPRSDIDVGVLFAEDPPSTLEGLHFGLEGEIEARFRVPVQLVVLNRAPVDLVHRVLREGRLVHETDRGARIRFEVKARNEYFDLQPILREYRQLEARSGEADV